MARKNKNSKKLIRKRMKKTGESYQAAQRQLLAQLARRSGDQVTGGPRNSPPSGTRFAIHQLIAELGQRSGEESVKPAATEAHRLRIERLNRRLKAAVGRLYSRKSAAAALAKFEEEVRQGKNLDHLVLVLEQMVRLRPALDAVARMQPALDAVARMPELKAMAEMRPVLDYRAAEQQLRETWALQSRFDAAAAIPWNLRDTFSDVEAVRAGIERVVRLRPEIDAAVEAAAEKLRSVQPALDAFRALGHTPYS